MTDNADLTHVIAQLATTEPHTTAGVDAIFTLANSLATEPEFAHATRRVQTGTGWLGFSKDAAAQQMLSIARDRGAPAAVAWLRKVSAVKEVAFSAVKALYGIKCSGRIPMSDSVILLPFADLPSSSTRDWILQEHEAANERGGGLRGFKAAPEAALLHAGGVRPLFLDLITPDLNSAPSVFAWFEELDEAALQLALIPKAIPMEAAHWLHVDDPDVARVVNFGISRSGPLDLHAPPYHDPAEATTESIDGLLPAFKNLNKQDRPRFKLAVDRLVRSRSQQIPGNRAIDLAIALEVLFMGADQGEHSYKISLRAARLLRDTVDARRTVFTEVQRVYELRSSMVHAGRGSDKYNVNGGPRTASDLVESVDVHCTDALRQVLKRGAIPETWRDIELS
jgi:hypothetical protein